jgi:hypothetical protein
MHAIVGTPPPGARVEKTTNVFTRPGHMYLLHDNPEQLEHDYRKIRTWETEGALLELE